MPRKAKKCSCPSSRRASLPTATGQSKTGSSLLCFLLRSSVVKVIPMMHRKLPLIFLVAGNLARIGLTAPMDVVPFSLPLPEGNGVIWEDPREIHQVIVHFSGAAPPPGRVRLEYWGSRWPQQHVPKDRQPGGADVGWMELGNWYN